MAQNSLKIMLIVEFPYLNLLNVGSRILMPALFYNKKLDQSLYYLSMSEDSSALWATIDDYESSLSPPQAFLDPFTHLEPDQSQISVLIWSASETHLSGNNKHFPSVPIQQPLSSLELGTESLHTQHDESTNLSPHEEDSSSANSPSRSKKRKDDNNNAHKVFITVLNTVLQRHKILEIIKKEQKDSGYKFDKGSRPSFIMRLIHVRAILMSKKKIALLKIILQDYIQTIRSTFQLSQNPSEAELLKNSLVEVYQRAIELFLQGKEEEATKYTYDFRNCKQDEYRSKGIEKVMLYLALKTTQ